MANLTRTRQPLTVKDITKAAENFEFNTNLQFRYWARSTKALYQEAVFAAQDHDYRRAYFHLYRHSILVLQYLPTHPEFKNPESKRLYKPLTRNLPSALQLMEEFKPQIEHEYKEWEKRQAASVSTLLPPTSTSTQRQMFHEILDPNARANVTVLDASQNLDLAMKVARQAQERRDNQQSQPVQRYGGDGRRWVAGPIQRTSASLPPPVDMDEETFRRNMETARRELSSFTVSPSPGISRDERSPRSEAGNYTYPSVNRSQPIAFQPGELLPSLQPILPVPPPPLKTDKLAPGESYGNWLQAELGSPTTLSEPPVIPAKLKLDSSPVRPPKIAGSLPPAPAVVPVKEPKSFVFGPGAYLESGEPLRPMFLPSGLRKAFVAIARPNTQKRIETCGMLCGAPQNSALYIHELLVPEQVGKEDTCETTNELAIFEHLEKNNLVCYGWIHTHPTQSCFMSSRDLHTHASYQAGLPEAIAIVCAPTSEPSYGIFRLTDPAGKDHILNCRQTATFHPHAIDNIYTRCNKPVGHVIEREDLTFTVVDQR